MLVKTCNNIVGGFFCAFISGQLKIKVQTCFYIPCLERHPLPLVIFYGDEIGIDVLSVKKVKTKWFILYNLDNIPSI